MTTRRQLVFTATFDAPSSRRDGPICHDWFVPAEDPGWAVSWRTLLWLFVPGLGIHRQRQRANDDDVDGLLMLRQLFLSFCLAIVVFGIVLAVLYPGSTPPSDPPTAAAVALLVAGALSTVVDELAALGVQVVIDAAAADEAATSGWPAGGSGSPSVTGPACTGSLPGNVPGDLG